MRLLRSLTLGAALLTTSPSYAQTIADATIERGRALLSKGAYKEIVDALDPVSTAGWPERQIVERHILLGYGLNETGQYDRAVAASVAGEAIARRLGAEDLLSRLISVRGTAARHREHPFEAIAHYRESLTHAEASGRPSLRADVYFNLAASYQALGQWETMLDLSERAFRLNDNPTDEARAVYLMQRGIALYEFGDRDGAVEAFNAALEIRRRQKNERGQSFALGELGLTMWEFDRNEEAALKYFDEAIALAANIPNLKTIWLNNAGGVQRDSGNYEEALRLFAASGAADRGADHGRNPILLKNTGQTLSLMGRYGDALPLLQEAAQEADRRKNGAIQWQARFELGRLHAAMGSAQAADQAFTSAIDYFERAASNVLLDNFRAGAFARQLRKYDPYDVYIRFLFERGQPERAFAIAERARARAFLDTLSSARDEIARRIPPEFVRQENTLLERITKGQAAVQAGVTDATVERQTLDDIRRAEDDLTALRVRLAVSQPDLVQARYPRLWQARDLQKQLLARDEAVLMFFLGEQQSWAWLVTRNRLNTTLLRPRHEIEAAVAAHLAQVRAPSGALPRLTVAGLLGADPAASLPDETRIIVVPHGALHYLPFETLTAADGRYLVEHFVLSYAPSVSSYAYLRQKRGAPAGAVVAVGNPNAGGGFKDLPHAGAELSAIEQLFGSSAQIFARERATEAVLHRDALSTAGVVHFATHAIIDESRPERSGLALTAAPPQSDGILQMREVYGLSLNAALVTLSGCETALGQHITGEGIVGLSRAFLNAGSHSVMASLWSVGDASTAQFMRVFYSRVRQGDDLDRAVREAKRAFIAGGGPRRHPYYWGAFVITGHAGTNAGLAESRVRRVTLAAAVALLLTAVAGAIIARRRKTAGAASM